MAAPNKTENCSLKTTSHKSASRGFTFTRCEQPGLGKGVPFLFGGEPQRTVLGKRAPWKVHRAHSRGCDKDKERETSFDSDDEFFSQDASLFMLNEVRIDRSTAEWNIKKEFQLRLKHSKMDIIY